MNAYFDTLKYMMILMLLIFLFSFPAIKIYSSYDGLKNEAMFMFTKYSLGNLGMNELSYINNKNRRFKNNMPNCANRFELLTNFMLNWINAR
jgi:hypothetical protein